MILSIISVPTLIHHYDDNHHKIRNQTNWHPSSKILVIIVLNRPTKGKHYDEKDKN
jgi:hypothetical protein